MMEWRRVATQYRETYIFWAPSNSSLKITNTSSYLSRKYLLQGVAISMFCKTPLTLLLCGLNFSSSYRRQEGALWSRVGISFEKNLCMDVFGITSNFKN